MGKRQEKEMALLHPHKFTQVHEDKLERNTSRLPAAIVLMKGGGGGGLWIDKGTE